jgi:hypothetical protein
MSRTKLILIEGMPGTGKSSVSQIIHHDLLSLGLSSRWLHEECEHPLRLFFDSNRHTTTPAYIVEATDRWQAFVDEATQGDDVFVVDSGILQNHVRSLLIFDADRNAILQLIRKIERVISTLSPKLVYLAPNSIKSHFDDISAIRGQRMLDLWIEAHDRYPYTRNAGLSGHTGFITFWQEFDAIATQAFSKLSLAKLRVEVDSNMRQVASDSIREFLGIAATSGVAPTADSTPLCGDWVPNHSPTGARIRLVLEADCLIALCDDPTIDVGSGPLGCFHKVRLVRKFANQFYVEAWPYEVSFEQSSGEKTLMQLSSTDCASKQLRETYVKL